jgi:acetoin utilization protein AcuB
MAMLVSKYMTPRPVTVQPNTPVDQAGGLLRRHQISQMPVVDSVGRLVGIITDRDIWSAGGGDPDRLIHLVVGEIMTTDVVTMSPDDDLRLALEVLYRQRFGGMPVVEDDVVVGIITVRDMLRCLRDELEMPPLLQEVTIPRLFADIL